MPDRVQVLKHESADQGGDALDSAVYPVGIEPQEDMIEAAGYYVQSATARDETVKLTRDASNNLILTDPAKGAIKLTELVDIYTHEPLDTLTHAINETCYVEVTRTSGKVSSVITWTSPAKTLKVREVLVTRDSNLKVTTVETKQYNGAGSVVQTLTSAITRTNNVVTSISNTRT